MFNISTKSQYGLRAMTYLARQKTISSLRKISKAEGISFDYLEKIVSKLEKAGLIDSKKGIQGGYILSRKASKIKIGEIISALEDKHLVKCVGESGCFCPREKGCFAKPLWEKLYKSLNNTLNSITLSDLIK
jgi:Rrf2 family protein